MNIVITLPHELIHEIKEGRKIIEVRSQIPKYFNRKKDVVYVVEKGTKNIALFFTIFRYEIWSPLENLDKKLATDAAVPEDWITQYRRSKRQLCVWNIACVCSLPKAMINLTHLRILRAPQGYVYSSLDWRKLHVSCYKWNPYLTNTEKAKLLKPVIEHNRWLFEHKKAVQ